MICFKLAKNQLFLTDNVCKKKSKGETRASLHKFVINVKKICQILRELISF